NRVSPVKGDSGAVSRRNEGDLFQVEMGQPLDRDRSVRSGMECLKLGGIFTRNLSALAEGNSRFVCDRPRAAGRSRLQPGPPAFLWRGGRTRVVASDSGRSQSRRLAAGPARIRVLVG